MSVTASFLLYVDDIWLSFQPRASYVDFDIQVGDTVDLSRSFIYEKLPDGRFVDSDKTVMGTRFVVADRIILVNDKHIEYIIKFPSSSTSLESVERLSVNLMRMVEEDK